jgi:mono/diheme cytochrome c family protein
MGRWPVSVGANPSTVPERRLISRMANPHLTDDQLADVAAYIMTLREHRAGQ